MATNRSYHDNCGMAHALDLIGERWALLVVRELLFGPKRFGDLKADLPGISSNVLTDRLAELEQSGVLTRTVLPPPAAVKVYELTPWGAELETVVRVIGRWGAMSPQLPRDEHLSVSSAMMSLRTNFDAAAAAGRTVRVGIQMEGEEFVADIRAGRLSLERSSGDDADLTVRTSPATLAGLLYAEASLDDAISARQLQLRGERREFERFLGLFRLPEPAASVSAS